MMTYLDTINFLFKQLPMYQNVGSSAIKKDLTNIRKLCNSLDHPQSAYPVIHIAGTNGKGTCTHMISSILQEAGMKVGIYTSPHYVDFRERIKINGQYISEQYVCEFVEQIREQITSIKPSFFEITVAMAFDYFRSKDVDIAVIETGLGGRLDSTNIVTPMLSVITNIGLDHQDMLGETYYEIAGEKAGIIKQGKPIVIGQFQNICDQVFFEKAKQTQSSISFGSVEWCMDLKQEELTIYHQTDNIIVELPQEFLSPFAKENSITSLEAIRQYNSLASKKISPEQMSNGLLHFRRKTNYTGRWVVLNEQPLVIADSAHNVDALEVVLSHLHQTYKGKIHFILGFVKGKKLDKFLSLLDPKNCYYFTQPTIFRALPVDQLKLVALKNGIQGSTYKDVSTALQHVQTIAESDDLIYVGGSSFIVGDILASQENFSFKIKSQGVD